MKAYIKLPFLKHQECSTTPTLQDKYWILHRAQDLNVELIWKWRANQLIMGLWEPRTICYKFQDPLPVTPEIELGKWIRKTDLSSKLPEIPWARDWTSRARRPVATSPHWPRAFQLTISCSPQMWRLLRIGRWPRPREFIGTSQRRMRRHTPWMAQLNDQAPLTKDPAIQEAHTPIWTEITQQSTYLEKAPSKTSDWKGFNPCLGTVELREPRQIHRRISEVITKVWLSPKSSKCMVSLMVLLPNQNSPSKATVRRKTHIHNNHSACDMWSNIHRRTRKRANRISTPL